MSAERIVYCPTCDEPVFAGDPCWDCGGGPVEETTEGEAVSDLDPEGVDAAYRVLSNNGRAPLLGALEAAIRAYLAAVPAPEVETEEQWAHWFTGPPYGCKSPGEAVRSGVLHQSPDEASARDFVSYAPDWRLARRLLGPWTPVDPEEKP